jgi:hypothetical protein
MARPRYDCRVGPSGLCGLTHLGAATGITERVSPYCSRNRIGPSHFRSLGRVRLIPPGPAKNGLAQLSGNASPSIRVGFNYQRNHDSSKAKGSTLRTPYSIVLDGVCGFTLRDTGRYQSESLAAPAVSAAIDKYPRAPGSFCTHEAERWEISARAASAGQIRTRSGSSPSGKTASADLSRRHARQPL